MRSARHVRLARTAAVAVGATIVVACTANTAYADGTSAQNLDITAHYAATITPTADTAACGGFAVSASGTAAGRPIGPYGTWQDQETVCTLTTPGEYDITGTAVIGGNDGDRVFVGYHVTAPLAGPGVTTIYPAGTFWVNGGTGDYAGATGGGTISAVVNLLDTAHTTATLEGYLH